MHIDRAVQHLSQAVRFATVSSHDKKLVDTSTYVAFAAFLKEAYPLVHQHLQQTTVNTYALVYRWPGKTDKRRVLLTAHYDVVPADAQGWSVPPFAGVVQEGNIYGRGTLDDKGSLIAIMEAVTNLLEEGFVPPHDVYLAFGFDEEMGGAEGAKQVVAYFQAQGLRFDYVLDEGGAVADGAIMGLTQPVAVVGVAEKGNTSLELTFSGAEGHSSTPPRDTAVSTMARLIDKVQRRPMKPRLTGTVKAMLKTVAQHKRGIQRLVMGHPEVFAPLIKKSMLKNRQTAAMLRTTMAFTMASGGSAHNVLPQTASCTVNVRLLQGDTVEGVLDSLRSHGIPFEVNNIQVSEATRASDIEAEGMRHLCRCIAAVFPGAVATPYLMVGGTDCRHYEQVADNCYRFLPARVTEEELGLMHGRGEYVSVENLATMISFYTLFLQELPA